MISGPYWKNGTDTAVLGVLRQGREAIWYGTDRQRLILLHAVGGDESKPKSKVTLRRAY